MIVTHPLRCEPNARGTRYQVTYFDESTGKGYSNDVLYAYASVAHTEAMAAIDSVLIACPAARVRYEVTPVRVS